MKLADFAFTEQHIRIGYKYLFFFGSFKILVYYQAKPYNKVLSGIKWTMLEHKNESVWTTFQVILNITFAHKVAKDEEKACCALYMNTDTSISWTYDIHLTLNSKGQFEALPKQVSVLCLKWVCSNGRLQSAADTGSLRRVDETTVTKPADLIRTLYDVLPDLA